MATAILDLYPFLLPILPRQDGPLKCDHATFAFTFEQRAAYAFIHQP